MREYQKTRGRIRGKSNKYLGLFAGLEPSGRQPDVCLSGTSDANWLAVSAWTDRSTDRWIDRSMDRPGNRSEDRSGNRCPGNRCPSNRCSSSRCPGNRRPANYCPGSRCPLPVLFSKSWFIGSDLLTHWSRSTPTHLIRKCMHRVRLWALLLYVGSDHDTFEAA